jgi:hypothetical protein
MNADDLPDALADWPSDDHEILGVGRRADERAIKLAYAERIKRFKPERFPQHFRRLREAYETVKRSNRWAAQYDDADNDEGEAAEEEPAKEAVPSPALAIVEAAKPERDDRWERACNGEHEAVFREYLALTETRASDPEPYVRLFWIATAFPELDSIDPIHWLCRGFCRSGEPERLLTLMEGELLQRPGASPAVALAVAVESQAPWHLRQRLALARWKALLVADCDAGPYVQADFSALQSTREDADDFALSCAAIEALLPEGQTYSDFIEARIDAIAADGSTSNPWRYERFDRLALLCEKALSRWRSTLPRRAMRGAMLASGHGYQAGLSFFWDYAQKLAAKPWAIVDELAGVFTEFPTAFYLLEQGFDWLRPRNGREIERSIEEDFWKIVESSDFRRNSHNHRWLFQFCIRFWVSPSQLKAALEHLRATKNIFVSGASVACDDPVVKLAWRVYAVAWTDYEPEAPSEAVAPPSSEGPVEDSN